MSEIHVQRAAFPILPTITTDDVTFSHSYSASDSTPFYDVKDAVSEFKSSGWFAMPGTLVLEANGSSITEWTVSTVGLTVTYNTNQSGTTPPAYDDERYISSFTLSAVNYDSSGLRNCSYSGSNIPTRAIRLRTIEGMCRYEYNITHGSSSTYEVLSLYRSASTNIPEYTRCAVTAYKISWEVEVWTKVNDQWTMTVDIVETIVTTTGNNYFYKAALVSAHNEQGAKSIDDITETIT